MFKIATWVLFWFFVPVGFSFAGTITPTPAPVGQEINYECEPAGVNFFVVTEWTEPYTNDGVGWISYEEYLCGDTFNNHIEGTNHLVEYDVTGNIVLTDSTFLGIVETTPVSTVPRNTAIVAGLWFAVFFGTIWIMGKTT